MICVSLGRGRHRMMQAEHQELARHGVGLVELRLDYIRRALEIRRLLADRPTPVVITARRPTDGGKWRGTEKDRVTLLRAAVAEGADYVDLESDIAGQIPRYGSTKRIISYHNFRETPADLEAIHASMLELSPDIVKIATMANDPHDNLRALRLCRKSPVPTIAFCMGEIGTPSRLLCGRFGAPFSYATFSDERQLAPGQLSYRTMRNVYRYDSIGPNTKVFGVVADPVAHSLSPLVHNRGFETQGIDAVYLPFRVPKECLAEFLADAPELGIEGLSVTIPHKEEAIRYAAKLDKEVIGIRATNTLLFQKDGIIASNTDAPAAVVCIEQALGIEEAKTESQPLAGKRILLLGAGGVARAIGWATARRGAEVLVAGRNHTRTEQFAKEMSLKAIDWIARHQCRPDVIVNCTPVGMHPHVDESPFEKQHLKSHMIVFDTVYNPEQTLLIKFARELECRVITGTEMFVRQAALQFAKFTGRPLSKQSTKALVRRAISAVRYDDNEEPATVDGDELSEAES